MTREDLDLIAPAAAILGRHLSQSEQTAIHKYLKILMEWNKIHRLVGSSNPKWLVDNIVIDSLLFLKVLPEPLSRVLDVGSGAGVPGIPLKIVRPEMELVMVDARRKRASFLAAAIRTLGLKGARVVHARIEEMTPREYGPFDVIVSRCVTRPGTLFGFVTSLLSPGGVAVVSGPPHAGGGDRHGFTWVRIVNPVSGAPRSFAVLRPAPEDADQS